MPLLPGEILNKRYRIVSLLAEGPYGAVYRAWDVVERRDYAIKEYLDASVQTQQLFRAEARRLTGLSHAGMPAFRDHFNLETHGQYLVSDYIDGIDLQSLLDQYGPLPEDLIITWLQAACQPLAYLHGKGHLHLNIKPANIRVTPAGDVFLVDTGLPGLGISVGISSYAAPEQASQTETTAASDIYSLGATLYTLLTGQVPPDALRRQSGLVTMKAAREINPDVSPYLSIVASRALDLRPDVRYESAADFAAALARPGGRAAPVPPDARRTPAKAETAVPLPRLPSRTRRQIEQRTIWGLVGVFVIVLLAGLIVTRLNREEELTGGSVAAATATTQSQIVAALTALSPTETPLPPPTETPEPTPAPLVDEKTGARMLFMPAGVFRLGNDEGEADQKPSLIVRLDSFYIDETEVTNGQYQACVAAEACAPPQNRAATYYSSYYGNPDYDNYPVIQVNWYQADNFCRWRAARLPTEAEWERAASFDPVALVKFQYPWGDTFDGERLNFCDRGCPRDYRDETVDDGYQDTAPVGSYPEGRSPIGALDMAGNVMEWVNDWYAFDYYEEATNANPLGPPEGTTKVLRGGSWLAPAADVTTMGRGNYDPTVARANLGFRCALTP